MNRSTLIEIGVITYRFIENRRFRGSKRANSPNKTPVMPRPTFKIAFNINFYPGNSIVLLLLLIWIIEKSMPKFLVIEKKSEISRRVILNSAT